MSRFHFLVKNDNSRKIAKNQRFKVVMDGCLVLFTNLWRQLTGHETTVRFMLRFGLANLISYGLCFLWKNLIPKNSLHSSLRKSRHFLNILLNTFTDYENRSLLHSRSNRIAFITCKGWWGCLKFLSSCRLFFFYIPLKYLNVKMCTLLRSFLRGLAVYGSVYIF